jgi:hypothetical protein
LDLQSLAQFLGQAPAPAPSLCDRALKLLDDGEARFKEAIATRSLSTDEGQMLDHGFWSIGLTIDPQQNYVTPTQDFLDRIASSNPNYTGWPIWLDARLSANAENRPKVINDAFEYLVISISSNFSNHIDFARLDPKGNFFLRRLLHDDGVPSRIKPGQALDPTLMILRIAEAMAVGIAFAKGLGWTPDQTALAFAFRWQQLKGRQLSTWANPLSDVIGGGTAHGDTIESCVQFSPDTPLSALPHFVDEATKRLFSAFDGATVPRRAIEDQMRRLFERRLGF